MPVLLPQRAAALAGVALLLGIAGDALLRAAPWGINAVIMGVALGAAVLYALRTAPASVLAVLLLAEACLSMLVWRDVEFLHVWGVLVFLAVLVLITAYAAGVLLPAIRLRDGVAAAFETALRAAGGAAMLVARDLPREGMTRSRLWRDGTAAAAGLLLTVPVVLVFGGLLRAAEPQFKTLTDALLAWNLPTVLSHIALAGLLAWASAGYLHGLATRRPWIVPRPAAAGLPRLRLRLAHVAIPLAALALMLLLFAGIQAQYLFGGADTVLRTTSLTVAEYARRGFFELVAVAALVLGLLLVSHAVIDTGSRATLRGVRALSVVLIGLVGVVMISAVVRMRLYVGNFGLSEDRIFATAFMLWVGAMLVWFAVTVLRGRAQRFAYGAVIAGLVMLLALGAINPHGLIVRTNIARAVEGHDLDTTYLNRLGADAVPAIVSAWPELDLQSRCALWYGVLRRWSDARDVDWRSLNLARRRAALSAAVPDPGCTDQRVP